MLSQHGRKKRDRTLTFTRDPASGEKKFSTANYLINDTGRRRVAGVRTAASDRAFWRRKFAAAHKHS